MQCNALISKVPCRRSYPLERITAPKPLGFIAIKVKLIIFFFSCYYRDIIPNKGELFLAPRISL